MVYFWKGFKIRMPIRNKLGIAEFEWLNQKYMNLKIAH